MAAAAPLVPQYVWCLVPLALANVLLNNLLARRRYGVVLPLLAVVEAYVLALCNFSETPQQLIGCMGAASLAALGVTAFYTWKTGNRRQATLNPA